MTTTNDLLSPEPETWSTEACGLFRNGAWVTSTAVPEVAASLAEKLNQRAALQAQLDAAQAEVARMRDWKNNLFDYLDRDGSLSTSTEDGE